MTTTQTTMPVPGIIDRHAILRRPIDQERWTAAWRLATHEGRDTPALNHPDAQVGDCRDQGCRSALVPTNPPEVVGRVRWFEAVCVRCDKAYAERGVIGINTHAAAAVANWQPGDGR